MNGFCRSDFRFGDEELNFEAALYIKTTKVHIFNSRQSLSDQLGMDYKQSFDNLNRLINSIRLWTDCQIFFFFNSETEFEIYIYEKELTDEQQAKVDENLYSTKPYGLMMFEESGQETLYYKDDMIDIHYDMFLEELIEVGYNDPIDMQEFRNQLSMFFKIMENK